MVNQNQKSKFICNNQKKDQKDIEGWHGGYWDEYIQVFFNGTKFTIFTKMVNSIFSTFQQIILVASGGVAGFVETELEDVDGGNIKSLPFVN